ncbi:MAG: porin family protein [Salibacteraceae bacterium]
MFQSEYSFSQQSSEESKFHAGLKAGINTSQITGDAASGFYKFSLVAGAFANYRINKKLKFQYELIYQQKGSNNPAKPDKGIYSSYKIRLNYIEIPLLLQYDLNRFEIELGPGIGYLINTKEWDQNGERTTQSSPYDWRKLELDAVLGVNYEIQKEHLFVNFRSHHSVTSIVSNSNQIPGTQWNGAWNIVLALTLNYQF